MEDIQIMVNEQMRLIHEDEDKFIFETIRAYTDGVLAHEGIFKIPKKLLERALICFRSEHPEEFMHLLKEGNEICEEEKPKACYKCAYYSESQYWCDNSLAATCGSCTKCERNFVSTDPYNQIPSWCPLKGE